MKTSVKIFCVLVGILPALLSGQVLAEKVIIPELDSLELGALAQQAAQQKKQLMVVYYQEDCAPCEQLSQISNRGDANATQVASSYALYKTDVGAGFHVVCPNGEHFADDEFMAIKGITALPAVVITDSFGNVTMVENGIENKAQLMAVADKYRNRNVVSNKEINY